jgi:hypothetical protein
MSILAKYAFSLLLAIPVLAALLVISLRNLGVWTLGIPLLTLIGVVYILPSLGNAYVSWILRGLVSHDSKAPDGLIVQITLCPRVRKGFRALIEDADDLGYLVLGETELMFQGDSLELFLPFERIISVHGENVGLRGLYVSSGRIRLDISGLDGFEAVEIAERASRVLPSSRKITRQLFQQIKSRIAA